MQQLSLKANILINDLTVKSIFTDLDKITQEVKTLDEGDTAEYNSIQKAFYLKTSSAVQATLTKGMSSVVITIKDSCLLSDAYDSIEIENITESATAEIFVVCG